MLQVKELKAGYGEVNILSNINITIEKGKMIAIIGANAAGKSTIVNTICGIVESRQGSIHFEGKDITKMKPYERSRMGIVQVPEGRSLFGELSVLDNLLVGSSFSKAKKNRKENLEYVFSLFPRLEERKDQIASTMSGGEQQMLAIGRALMCMPELLILDEPSLGLAPIVVTQIFETIQELKKKGMTVLLIEQNVKHALQLCDYGYVLEHGRVVLEGTGEELLKNPKTKEAYLGK